MHDFFMEIGELAEEDMSDEGFVAFQNVMNVLGPTYNYSIIIGSFFSLGLFMFGNLLFKTHKTGKTFGIMMGVSYILSMIMQSIMLASNFRGFLIHADPNNVNANLSAISNMTTEYMTVSLIINIVLTLALYVGIFFKLKKQKY